MPSEVWLRRLLCWGIRTLQNRAAPVDIPWCGFIRVLGIKSLHLRYLNSETREDRVSEEDRSRRFQETALPHLNAAYNLARWLVRNDHDAEDVVQEAYLRAFRFFDGFHGETGRAWLLTIVRNTCYTWMQHHRDPQLATQFDEDCHSLDEQGAAGEVSQALDNPEAILARRDDARELNAALQALPLEFREVLVMRELEELSYKEIACIANVPIGTVMSRLARGRKLLVERMTKEGEGNGLQRGM